MHMTKNLIGGEREFEDVEEREVVRRKWLNRKAAAMTWVIVVILLVMVWGSVSWKKEGRSQIFESIEAEPEITQVPGTTILSRGYNLFRGKFLDASSARHMGWFRASNSIARLENVEYTVPQGVTITEAPRCERVGRSTSTYRTTSMSDVRAQGNKQSYGYDSTTTVSASVPIGPVEVGASRDIRTALIFGTASSQTEAYGYASSDYNYRVTAQFQARAYSARVAWTQSPSSFFTFEQSMSSTLNSVKSADSAHERNKRVFYFMETFGSHVIEAAEMGAECSKSIFMKGGNTADSYAATQNTVHNNEAEFFGLKFGSTSSSEKRRATDSSTGVSYAEMNEICHGVVRNNICDSAGNGVSLAPVATVATTLPMWNEHAAIPGFDAAVRHAFQTSVDELVVAAGGCRNRRCGGRGVCVLSDHFWWSVSRWGWSGVFSDSDFNGRCVCEQGSGDTCVIQPQLPIYTQSPQNILIGGGVSGSRRFLSCTSGGSVDLWTVDDYSGRQRWTFKPVVNGEEGEYNILVYGGTNSGETYLSTTSNGELVDLYHTDDGSGRQRWRLDNLGGGVIRIRISRGVSGSRRYLSVTGDGKKVDLWTHDDSSGRQRWTIQHVNL